MPRGDAVEDIRGITAVSVSVGIEEQVGIDRQVDVSDVGFIPCGVLRSDWIPSLREL